MTRLSLALVAPHGEGALRARLGESTALGFGGAEIQMALLGTGLASRGHQVAFLCASDGPDIREQTLGPVRLVQVPMGGRLGQPPAGGIQSWLQRGLDTAGADLVYQRCALPLTGRLAWACARSGRRFVFAVANDRDLDGRIRHALGWRRFLMYRYGLWRADLVVVQSRHQQSLLGSRRRRRSLLLPSVFDLQGVVPSGDARPGAVLWVGNILAKKRPHELLSLARQLPAQRFIAVGSSEADPALGDVFRREAAALPNVEYAGQVPHGRMGEFYARAALLLNTSSAEGMPNTFLEAWARGIPVATLGVDPDGLLSRAGLGFVLDQEDAAGALGGLLADRGRLRETGERGREHVHVEHDLPTVVERFEAALSSLARET